MHRLFIAVHRSAILLWYLLRIGSDGGWGNTTFFCQQNHYMESHHGMIAHNSNQNSEFIKKVNFKNEKLFEIHVFVIKPRVVISSTYPPTIFQFFVLWTSKPGQSALKCRVFGMDGIFQYECERGVSSA